MEQFPIYIDVLFILTTLLTIWLLFKATNYSRPVIIISLSWLILQAAVSLTGFYTVTTVSPPRFGLLLIPPVMFIIALFFTGKGRRAIATYNPKLLTLLHIVRIPVEFGLLYLYLYHAIPGIMTFEGRNFDILCGLTAPVIYYFGYIKNKLNKTMLVAWNIVCLLLLANIIFTAVLSAPFPFQKFGFDQPNIALLYFPFVWLPGFIVPAVFFAHLVTLKRLMR